MAWWEGGCDSWEGEEVGWWATDRLVRGLNTTIVDIRSLRPCTWLDAGRQRGGGGVQWREVWCEKPSNYQWEFTQHGGLTCKSTWRTRRSARLQPAYSARRPARRCVVCTRVACHLPRWYVTGNVRIDVMVSRNQA